MADLREVLTGIYETRGELHPQTVVDEARPDDHPLHSRFEWDNEVAGEAYRRVQASELIRSVRLVYAESPTGETKSVRAFSSLHATVDPERRGYAPTVELVENPLTKEILLRHLAREINHLQAKYGHLTEFADTITNTIKKKGA